MNYNESLAYLDSLGKFGIKLGMERIEALLKELDNPQDKFKSVHVTGTKRQRFRKQHDCQYPFGR